MAEKPNSGFLLRIDSLCCLINKPRARRVRQLKKEEMWVTILKTLPPLELTCQYKDRGAEFYEYNSAYLVGIKDDLAYVIKGKE